jgi:hypothetical protein
LLLLLLLVEITLDRGLLSGVIASDAKSLSSWSELSLRPQNSRYLRVMCLW